MLMGIYKSFEELEEYLTLEELNLMLKADHAKEERMFRVLAAVNGVPWSSDGEVESGEDAMERIKKQAEAIRLGKSVEEIELGEIGIKFE